jgi:hypothetical protein
MHRHCVLLILKSGFLQVQPCVALSRALAMTYLLCPLQQGRSRLELFPEFPLRVKVTSYTE